MSSARLVHLIDDDGAVRDAVCLLLRVHGYTVQTYPSPHDFLAGGADGGCVLTDVSMPGMTGLDLLAGLRASGRDLPVIVMTGRADPHLSDAASEHGALAFLHKPFAPAELVASVERALGPTAAPPRA